MAYVGKTVQIPLGRLGLVTDMTKSDTPEGSLDTMLNVEFDGTNLTKGTGAAKINTVALSDEIVGLYDWFPNARTQRLIAVTRDGKVYRDTGDGAFNSQTAINDEYASFDNQLAFVEGGAEDVAANKKLFLFSRNNPPQVLSGDGTTFTEMSEPATDWDDSPPTGGVIFDGSLCVFGNPSDPHRLYISNAEDHEDFTTSAKITTYSVFPGEGDGIAALHVYNGKLFVFKRPYGVYVLDSRSATRIEKLKSDFGAASPSAIIEVLNDVLVKNTSGSISSLASTEKFGDVESGDLLRSLRVEDYVTSRTSNDGLDDTHALYYTDKKKAYFTYRSKGSNRNDLLLTVDWSQEKPRVAWHDRFQANCLTLRRDEFGTPRPIYGDANGFIYRMDVDLRSIAGTAFSGEFTLPDLDFGFADPSVAGRVKNFDAIELVGQAEGDWNLTCEACLDGAKTQTIQFKQLAENGLDDFTLDADATDQNNLLLGDTPEFLRKRMVGSGRRLKLRFYNNNAGERFTLNGVIISFRLADEKARRR